MSLILIGFGKQTHKDVGETGRKQPCAWCSRQVFYHLAVVETWFTLFFIPIYAYRREYRVECPLCGGGLAIGGREVDAARRGELVIRRE